MIPMGGDRRESAVKACFVGMGKELNVGRQRMWLPPTYGKVRYDDMDEESRCVVDEFQGREKYDEVMNAPGEYIIDTRQAPLLIA